MPYMSMLTTTTATIDTSVADSIVELVTKVLELFQVYPLNIFLGATLIGVGIGVYRGLKRS